MPIIKSLFKSGNSRAIILPAKWLEYWEKQKEQEITEVGIEVNNKLVVIPLFNKKGR